MDKYKYYIQDNGKMMWNNEYRKGIHPISDYLINKYKNNFGEFQEEVDGRLLSIESKKEYKTKDINIIVADEISPNAGNFYMEYRYK